MREGDTQTGSAAHLKQRKIYVKTEYTKQKTHKSMCQILFFFPISVSLSLCLSCLSFMETGSLGQSPRYRQIHTCSSSANHVSWLYTRRCSPLARLSVNQALVSNSRLYSHYPKTWATKLTKLNLINSSVHYIGILLRLSKDASPACPALYPCISLSVKPGLPAHSCAPAPAILTIRGCQFCFVLPTHRITRESQLLHLRDPHRKHCGSSPTATHLQESVGC